MGILILGYFYYVSNRRNVDEVEEITAPVSVVQQLIHKNIENDYPPTPREGLRLYADITVAYYTEEYTDEERELLAKKMRELLDEELLLNNPELTNFDMLKEEISDYKSKGIVISSYNLSSATDVDYFKQDGSDFARMRAVFTVKQATQVGLSKEIFILRKDSSGHWKIYGWTLAKDEG